MKQLFLIMALAINFFAYSQADKTVTLVVSAQGETQEEAKQNALRNAIEQAFGTFISSNTEILNDELVKDEIVSISNGNIKKFEVISEVEIPEVGHATTLKATVSINKLTTFVESKGVEIEFKGSLFGANIKQQRMNEEAEWKSIINLCEVSNSILSKSLDYSIEIGEPVKAQRMRSFEPKTNDYQIMLTITASPNINFDKFVNYFFSSIKSIAMPVFEQEDYKKLKKKIYPLIVKGAINTKSEKKPKRKSRKNKKENSERKVENFFFRNRNTTIALQNLFLKSNQYLHNFKVRSNLDTINVKTCCEYRNDNKITHNIHYSYGKPEIWHLNSGNSIYDPDGSRNTNSGYPQFNFIYESNMNFGYGYKNLKVSSWRTYFEYLRFLTNNEILFASNTYFTKTGQYYMKNGTPISRSLFEYPYRLFPGDNEIIGEINLEKIDYYSKYLAIYSEEEISEITNISVKKLK